MKRSSLYLPPLSYPQTRSVITDEIFTAPCDALPETRLALDKLLAYRHVKVGDTELSVAVPMVSTGYFFCSSLVVRAGGILPSRTLTHIVNGESPFPYLELIRSSFSEWRYNTLDGVLIMCPPEDGSVDRLIGNCESFGIRIRDLVEIEKVDEWTAPHTDVIVQPLAQKVRVVSEGRAPIDLSF